MRFIIVSNKLLPQYSYDVQDNLCKRNESISDNLQPVIYTKRKIQKITEQLKNGKFNPTPVRRTYIQKKNSDKMRPLGIPTFTDKLVQEAVRMILEAVYEPIFHECSHGFRPNRSCHTALKSLRMKFTGAKWFIEGDIKGCFDNINHDVLIGILNKKSKTQD